MYLSKAILTALPGGSSSSMNPAKRAKVETDLQRQVQGLFSDLQAHFEHHVFSLVIEDTGRGRPENFVSPATTSFDAAWMDAVVHHASSKMGELTVLVSKHTDKLGYGESLRLGVDPLLQTLLRLLRIQPTSSRSDRISAAEFKKMSEHLPKLHHWALDQMVAWLCLTNGPACLVPFAAQLGDVLEHFIGKLQDPHVLPLVKMIYSESALVALQRSIGRSVAQFLLKQLSGGMVVPLEVAGLLLRSPGTCGVPLPLADSLFEALVELSYALFDHPSDEVLAALISAIAAGSVGIQPAYLSPRAPLVIRIIDGLVQWHSLGPASIDACHAALQLIDLAVHPVRALPPVQTSVRRARVEALMVDAVVEEPAQQPPGEFQFHIETISSFVPDQGTIEVEPIEQPSVISVPNVLMASEPTNTDDATSPETANDDDDEALPELILD